MENLGEIYCITSPSGKKYVGQCVKILSSGKNRGYISRWKEHITDAYYKDCCRLLNSSIRKYGHENFTIEVLKECIKTLDEGVGFITCQVGHNFNESLLVKGLLKLGFVDNPYHNYQHDYTGNEIGHFYTLTIKK